MESSRPVVDLPGRISDLQLVVVEGGPHATAWAHAPAR